MKLTKLIVLAAVACSTAMEVKIKRWSREGCSPYNLIRDFVTLQSETCTTFSHYEPSFRSFMLNLKGNNLYDVKSIGDPYDVADHTWCQTTVYEEPDCIGDGMVYGDRLTETMDKCGNVYRAGRSLQFHCEGMKGRPTDAVARPISYAEAPKTNSSAPSKVPVQTNHANAPKTEGPAPSKVPVQTSFATLPTSTAGFKGQYWNTTASAQTASTARLPGTARSGAGPRGTQVWKTHRL